MAIRSSGSVEVDVTYNSQTDEYRGELSWPEVSPMGIVSPSIRHHYVERIQAAPVLAQFTNVSNPRAPEKLDVAAAVLIRGHGLERYASWEEDRAGARRMRISRVGLSKLRVYVVEREFMVNDAPGGHQVLLEPGDRVEAGGVAGNTDFLIAHRALKQSVGVWKRLGPHAVVPIRALRGVGKSYRNVTVRHTSARH
jgi:hypothetical protein